MTDPKKTEGGPKPCPWCKTSDRLSVRRVGSAAGGFYPYAVRCSHLDCDEVQGPTGNGAEEARKLWNAAHTPDTLSEGGGEGEHVQRVLKHLDYLSSSADMAVDDVNVGRTCTRAARIIRAASSPAPVVGMVGVPVEATEAMLDAFWRGEGESGEMRSRSHARGKRQWSAMLAASPAIPSPAQVPEQGDLVKEAAFLLGRLDEMSSDALTEEGVRDWSGHVSPSIARLRTLLNREQGR